MWGSSLQMLNDLVRPMPKTSWRSLGDSHSGLSDRGELSLSDDAHGFVLHVFWLKQAHDHPGRCELGAAFERDLGFAVLLLVLHVARWRQRHRMGQQQDCVHVLPHRHGEYAGVHHDSVR